MKKMKRILCFFLVFALFFSASLTPAIEVKAATYPAWKQNDPRWGSLPLGKNGTMAAWGCKITTLAMLMVGAGVESESNFNPGVLRNRYTNAGYISYSSNVELDGNLSDSALTQTNSPNFYKVGSADYTYSSFSSIYSSINSLLNSGYHVEVRVDYNRHSVAVTRCSGGVVYINDPGYSKTTLNQWDGTIIRADYYKANGTTADTLPASGYNYPTTLTAGQTYSIYGTVSSAVSNISQLTVGVYNTLGQLVTGKTVYPNAKSYNIANVDAYVYFNNLPPGTYDYKAIATNASSNSTVINKRFTVVSTLTASGYNYPTSLPYGKAYSIYGTVTSSNSNITQLTIGVYNTSGTLVTGKTVYPNTRSYNIANVDAYVYFNKLARGTYYYKVIGTNASGTTTVINKQFTVY